MVKFNRLHFISTCILLGLIILMLPSAVLAYPRWSVNDDATYCGACHGDFRSGSYVSTVDGQNWGNLHNLHRNTMVSGDCTTCHNNDDYFPVVLDSSSGGSGLAAISCMGCHGRAEDNNPQNPSYPNGAGAGLRQHHNNAGVGVCLGCHDDANPANYTTVSESTQPPYYANPGINHPNMPTGACNDDGSENFAGAAIGLDNDGNELYDDGDPACNVTGVDDQPIRIARLLQNHPNPFNPSTIIEYAVDQPGEIRLGVYSLQGKHIRSLVNRHHDGPMTYQVTWNGRDDAGRSMASGVFFYRLESAGAVEMKKMVLLK